MNYDTLTPARNSPTSTSVRMRGAKKLKKIWRGAVHQFSAVIVSPQPTQSQPVRLTCPPHALQLDPRCLAWRVLGAGLMCGYARPCASCVMRVLYPPGQLILECLAWHGYCYTRAHTHRRAVLVANGWLECHALPWCIHVTLTSYVHHSPS